jgi:hypothetical protein
MKDALDAWEQPAIALLEGAARRYNGFVTYGQLGEHVRAVSGINHDGLLPNWIGEVLGRVIDHCIREGLPILSSLCVTAEGTVGDGYRAAIDAERRTGRTDVDGVETLDHLDDHAARARLECYRFYGADLPRDGGVPTLTPQVAAARKLKRQKAKREEPAKLCPRCFVALPATGQCDECS